MPKSDSGWSRGLYFKTSIEKEITEIIAKLAHSYQEERKQETIQKVFQQKVEVIQENSKNDYHSNMKRYMEENYTDSQFSLGVLAEKLNLSSGYLSILFKKTFGIPFQDYLLQLRMEKAKLLLLTTHLKIMKLRSKLVLKM